MPQTPHHPPTEILANPAQGEAPHTQETLLHIPGPCQTKTESELLEDRHHLYDEHLIDLREAAAAQTTVARLQRAAAQGNNVRFLPVGPRGGEQVPHPILAQATRRHERAREIILGKVMQSDTHSLLQLLRQEHHITVQGREHSRGALAKARGEHAFNREARNRATHELHERLGGAATGGSVVDFREAASRKIVAANRSRRDAHAAEQHLVDSATQHAAMTDIVQTVERHHTEIMSTIDDGRMAVHDTLQAWNMGVDDPEQEAEARRQLAHIGNAINMLSPYDTTPADPDQPSSPTHNRYRAEVLSDFVRLQYRLEARSIAARALRDGQSPQGHTSRYAHDSEGAVCIEVEGADGAWARLYEDGSVARQHPQGFVRQDSYGQEAHQETVGTTPPPTLYENRHTAVGRELHQAAEQSLEAWEQNRGPIAGQQAWYAVSAYVERCTSVAEKLEAELATIDQTTHPDVAARYQRAIEQMRTEANRNSYWQAFLDNMYGRPVAEQPTQPQSAKAKIQPTGVVKWNGARLNGQHGDWFIWPDGVAQRYVGANNMGAYQANGRPFDNTP